MPVTKTEAEDCLDRMGGNPSARKLVGEEHGWCKRLEAPAQEGSAHCAGFYEEKDSSYRLCVGAGEGGCTAVGEFLDCRSRRSGGEGLGWGDKNTCSRRATLELYKTIASNLQAPCTRSGVAPARAPRDDHGVERREAERDHVLLEVGVVDREAREPLKEGCSAEHG